MAKKKGVWIGLVMGEKKVAWIIIIKEWKIIIFSPIKYHETKRRRRWWIDDMTMYKRRGV